MSVGGQKVFSSDMGPLQNLKDQTYLKFRAFCIQRHNSDNRNQSNYNMFIDIYDQNHQSRSNLKHHGLFAQVTYTTVSRANL